MNSSNKYLSGFLTLLVISGGLILPLINEVDADQEALATDQDLELTVQDTGSLDELILTIQNNSAISNNSHFYSEDTKTIYVIVTAYSSTPCQTDDTPFLTASQTAVRDGIVAANFLPFGTKIKIPKLFGNKVFVVEDRMSYKKGYHVDVWFSSRQEALEFGAHLTYIEIVE